MARVAGKTRIHRSYLWRFAPQPTPNWHTYSSSSTKSGHRSSVFGVGCDGRCERKKRRNTGSRRKGGGELCWWKSSGGGGGGEDKDVIGRPGAVSLLSLNLTYDSTDRSKGQSASATVLLRAHSSGMI